MSMEKEHGFTRFAAAFPLSTTRFRHEKGLSSGKQRITLPGGAKKPGEKAPTVHAAFAKAATGAFPGTFLWKNKRL